MKTYKSFPRAVMERALCVLAGLLVVVSGVAARANPLLAGEPYKDILDNPNFRPKPEVVPNKTIDQLITDAYGGLPIYMSENFLDLDGDITTELDLVLTPEQFKAMYMTEKAEDGRYKRKATRPLAYRWTDKTIPYEFVTSHFSADEVYYIKAAMNRWQETTCLKFRPYVHGRDNNRIRFQNGNGCNSLLGMARGVQPINLQAPGCRYSGLYLHEIGHAIGLVHEHQLPDRDQYIYILYDNVAPSMRVWFNKYSTKDVNQYGVPFEYSSVMHYGITAFSKDGTSQTIRARDRSREKEIGRVYLKGLSFSDVKVVNLMYNCNKHCAADPNCKDPGYLDKNCNCVRPDDDDGTTTTTSKPGACENLWDDGQCAGWARDGECDLNPMWMKENCKRSCNSCDDDDKPDPEECTNIWGDRKCQGWADTGECDANPIWMKQYCSKSCKVCKTTGTGTTTKPQCTDNGQYCASWAKSGYCLTNWYTKENCKKSCNTCDDQSFNDDDDTGNNTDDTIHEDEEEGTEETETESGATTVTLMSQLTIVPMIVSAIILSAF